MNKRKQKLIIMICICALIFLSGCSEKKITYTYDNKKEITALALTKSVYSDGKLQVYISDLEGDFDLTCYDADFQKTSAPTIKTVFIQLRARQLKE